MNSPAIDIIVPVWNNLFETRACLAAIREHSASARLIIVDNGSSRETELMLEEFSESLGDQGLFIKSERNIGLVAAINLGLARSDSMYAVIVRPTVTVQRGWLDLLVSAAETSGAALVSPLFKGVGAPVFPKLVSGCTVMEHCMISFETLLLRGEMHTKVGLFDENLDGNEWCLREYVRRATEQGYRTCLTGRLTLHCSAAQQFGSAQRRSEMIQQSRAAYLSRWGISRHYCVIFDKTFNAEAFDETVDAILDGARKGHRFTLLLHRRHYSLFRKKGWHSLHTGIDLQPISLLFPARDLQRKMAALQKINPDLLAVSGSGESVFPGADTAITLDEMFAGMNGSPSTRSG